MNKKFATAINCMDGRAQKPILEFIEKSFGVDYVDMITEPGPNKILAENNDISLIESLKKRIEISVEKHASKAIAVVGHYDCAGNPETEEVQKDHLKKAVKVVAGWGFSVDKIIAVWLDENFAPSAIE